MDMPIFIFDVDYTLYDSKDIPEDENDTEDITELFYSLFRPKETLIKLLSSYIGSKFLFSNGNLSHVGEVIEKIGLKRLFPENKIATLDDYPNRPKPYVKSFKFAINKFKIPSNQTVYFFEDNLDNLRTAKKKYNWKTIFIDEDKTTNKKLSHHSFIDYTFKNINIALEYLINKINKQQMRAQNKLNKQKINKIRSPKISPRRKPIRSRRKIDKRFTKSNNFMKINRINRLNRLNQSNDIQNINSTTTSTDNSRELIHH